MTDFATLMRAQVEISATGQSAVGLALQQTISSVKDVKAEIASFGTDFKQLFIDTRTNAERYKATVDTLVDTLKKAREEADRLADSQKKGEAHRVISDVESRILPEVERDFDVDGSFRRKREADSLTSRFASDDTKRQEFKAYLASLPIDIKTAEAAYRAFNATLDDTKAKELALANAAALRQQQMNEGKAIVASLATEAERIVDKESQLNTLISAGAITREQANAALAKYKDTLPSASAARERLNQLELIANQTLRDAETPGEKQLRRMKDLDEAYEKGAFGIVGSTEAFKKHATAMAHVRKVYSDATISSRRFSNAIQQGSYGVQDFVQVLGDAGLGRALMASANNFSQVAAVAIPGFGAALAGVVITAGAAFLNFMGDAKKKTLEFNQALKETVGFFKDLEERKDVREKVREAAQQTPDEVRKRIARLRGGEGLGQGAIADAQQQEANIQKNRDVRMANQFGEVINILGAVKTPIRGFLEGKTTVGEEDARASIGRQLFGNAEPGAVGKLNAAFALPGSKTVQDSYRAMLRKASAMAGEDVSESDMRLLLDPLHARFNKRAIHLFSRMSQNALQGGQFRELEMAIKAVDKDAGEKFAAGLAKFREESENASRATKKLTEELAGLERVALPAAMATDAQKKRRQEFEEGQKRAEKEAQKRQKEQEEANEKERKRWEKFEKQSDKIRERLKFEEGASENPMRAKLADIARDFRGDLSFVAESKADGLMPGLDRLTPKIQESALRRTQNALRNERKRLRDLEDTPDAKFTDIQGLGKSIQESLTVTKEERDRKEQIELAKKNIAVGEKIEQAVKDGNGSAATFAARGGGGG